VEIAGMVRNDDAGVVGLHRAALDAHGAADAREKQPRGTACDAPAPREARRSSEHEASRNRDDEQGEPGVTAVPCSHDSAHGVVPPGALRNGEVETTFMSKHASPRGDTRSNFPAVFCDTFLFMLMLVDFC